MELRKEGLAVVVVCVEMVFTQEVGCVIVVGGVMMPCTSGTNLLWTYRGHSKFFENGHPVPGCVLAHPIEMYTSGFSCHTPVADKVDHQDRVKTSPPINW